MPAMHDFQYINSIMHGSADFRVSKLVSLVKKIYKSTLKFNFGGLEIIIP